MTVALSVPLVYTLIACTLIVCTRIVLIRTCCAPYLFLGQRFPALGTCCAPYLFLGQRFPALDELKHECAVVETRKDDNRPNTCSCSCLSSGVLVRTAYTKRREVVTQSHKEAPAVARGDNEIVVAATLAKTELSSHARRRFHPWRRASAAEARQRRHNVAVGEGGHVSSA